MLQQPKTAIIIGAGPAGLTAALELLRRTDVRPIVLEASSAIGGISRTVNLNGYRMDIGGHRFFSKSDWVMDWWQKILPLEPESASPGAQLTLNYRQQERDYIVPDANPVHDTLPGEVMLVRARLSRIYFLRKFFDYPIKLNANTLANLGPVRCTKAGMSYARAVLFPRKPERSLEDFLINRFGGEMYRTFFKSYTEKVWGVPCAEISAEWGAQRIKGLSLTRAMLHAFRQALTPAGPRSNSPAHTSLVERFLYPRLGPGQLWEAVARRVLAAGGDIRMEHEVQEIQLDNGQVVAVAAHVASGGGRTSLAADYVISTMPVKDLFAGFRPAPPESLLGLARSLPYREFITVGVVARRMRVGSQRVSAAGNAMLPDNWIYIQDPDVKLGRLQIFNNWSPALVPEADRVWLGLEYFCTEHDELWRLSDAEMQALAIKELAHVELVDPADVISATVIRVPKAYPAYFGTYAQFDALRAFTDAIPNLFLIGRNGMHRYNNQDHSMLTAKAAVDNIVSGCTDKQNIWSVNVDDDYHEESEGTANAQKV